ncbi:MAG TPA: GAF domain-containing protein [Bacteroidetes bacterium]|nr:GAF domain-containing protein [Bacteroidota bacterium]
MRRWLDRAVRALIWFIGGLLSVSVIISGVHEATKLASWGESGMVLSSVVPADSLARFVRVEPSDFLRPPIPANGDTLLLVGDSTATMKQVTSVFDAPNPPGREVSITFLHDSVPLQTTVRTRRPAASSFYALLILQVFRFLIALSFIAVSFWAFRTRPGSAGIRALALFGFAMASFLVLSVRALNDNFAGFTIPYFSVIRSAFTLFALFFGAFWLNLQFYFPRPLPFVRRHPLLVHAICYLPPALFFISSVLASQAYVWFLRVGFLTMIGGLVGGGFALLWRSHVRASTPLERRQTRLVLWGSGLGLGLLFAFFLVVYLGGDWFTSRSFTTQLILVNLLFLALFFSPLSFAWAFGRYGLLEVQGRLRRGTRFLLVTGVLLAVFFAVLYAASELLVRNLGITDRAPTLILALVLALGFAPAQRRVRGVVERRFFPEREQLRRLLREFLDRAGTLPNREALWTELCARLKEGMRVRDCFTVARAPGDGAFLREEVEPTPFVEESEAVQRLSHSSRPMLLDEALASGRVRFTGEERAWLQERQVALLLPMMAGKRLTGFLCFGAKTTLEEFDPEELRVLTELSSQVALAAENLLLLEENLEKQRMQEELELARNIQEGFLPRTLPETPGLDLAALCRFSREVAGDYYDVIPLGEDRTVIAIGDVSGKGAGAALIMASLQASLRALSGVGVELAQMVEGVNNLIHQNTPAEQYVTFFIAMNDARKRALSYVNAGHNPPVLFRDGGGEEELTEGGLILGALPDVSYRAGRVQLAPNDMLLLYTDGVTEAMNPEEEEFGEERLMDLVRGSRARPLEELLEAIQEEVSRFTEGQPFPDDFTLLLARAVE